MGLSIYLDSLGCYTNYDNLSGIAKLEVQNRIDVKSITVEFYGNAYAENTRYRNERFETHSTAHELVLITTTIFPPKEVSSVSSAKSFTLTPGSYSYPFSIRLPGADFVCNCNSWPFHNIGYTGSAPNGRVRLPGSFYCQHGPSNYCFVAYEAKAKVHTPLINFDLRLCVPVKFLPRFDCMSFSFQQLCDLRMRLKADYDVIHKKIKFEGENGMHQRNFFKRLVGSKSVNVPFELKVTFKDENKKNTDLGTCNRLLSPTFPLSHYIDISLGTKYRHEDIRKLLTGNSDSKKPEKADSANVAIRVTYFMAEIVLYLDWVGAETTRVDNRCLLIDRSLDLQFLISDLEVNDEGLYSLYLDPSLLNCHIPSALGISFYTYNIRQDFELHIRLHVCHADSPNKISKLKINCPIVITNPEFPVPVHTYQPPPYN